MPPSGPAVPAPLDELHSRRQSCGRIRSKLSPRLGRSSPKGPKGMNGSFRLFCVPPFPLLTCLQERCQSKEWEDGDRIGCASFCPRRSSAGNPGHAGMRPVASEVTPTTARRSDTDMDIASTTRRGLSFFCFAYYCLFWDRVVQTLTPIKI